MKRLFILLGPTAVGKTDVSIELAQYLHTDIISADSRQLYRELKIGTAVPTSEQLEMVKHYFIGNKSIREHYNAGMYELEVIELLSQLHQEQPNVLMVGGSGLYIDAVCKGIDDLPTVDLELRDDLVKRWKKFGIENVRFELKKLDPDYYGIVDLRNPQRILKALEVCLMTGKTYSSFRKNKIKNRDFEIIKIGLNRDRGELHERINKRVDQMIEAGLVEEARQFLSFKDLNGLNTVGYKELFPYFEGNNSLETAIELIKRNSRQYARRQISWFNRDGDVQWFHPEEREKIKNFINEKIKLE
jgi:tRNA dimethylallyltransferase